jgi:hypothetical protein
MQTLYALDLTQTPQPHLGWRRPQLELAARGEALEQAASLPGVPRDGFASPLGFWFAGAESWTASKPRLRVEFCELDELIRPNPEHQGQPRDLGAAGRLELEQVRLDVPRPARRARASRASFPLILEIRDNTARIGVSAETWKSVGDTVLLVVAQFWRFGAIDRKLDELSEWARNDLIHTTGLRNTILPRRVRNLYARGRSLRSLILDLPDFEAALTNPRGWLASGPMVRLYRELASQLGLHRWRREIDERVEVVEAVFDSLAESLNHLQSLAYQVALELIIVAVLLLDAGLFLVDALAQK